MALEEEIITDRKIDKKVRYWALPGNRLVNVYYSASSVINIENIDKKRLTAFTVKEQLSCYSLVSKNMKQVMQSLFSG